MFHRASIYLAAALSAFLILTVGVFAEGTNVCNGKLIGTTTLNNPNAGQTYFDSHQSVFSDANQIVDLSLALGAGQQGLAPEAMEHAACADETTPTDTPFANKQYQVQGWAWNDNLGFISFYCGGGQNPAVDTDSSNAFSPVACGPFNYAVTIGTESAGVRQFDGYAWNNTFGYINFSCENGLDALGQACGAIDYGVTMNGASGNVTGFAWSEAGVWLDFSGLTVDLPFVPGVSDDCADLAAQPRCMTVDPDPRDFIGLNALGTAKVADGRDFYQIDLYLMENDGVTPLDIVADNVTIEFFWSDTVKASQLAGVSGDFSDKVSDPAGGIIFKPGQLVQTDGTGSDDGDGRDGESLFSGDDRDSVDGSRGTGGESSDGGDGSRGTGGESSEGGDGRGSDGASITPLNFFDVFEEVEPGHYRLKPDKTIRSYAPTSNENVSLTTSTQPPFLFSNERFFTKVAGITDKTMQPNDLTLDYAVVSINGVAQPPILPNGVDGLDFRFRPAIELDTLYANDFEDSILGIRGIPTTYQVKAKENGSLTATAKQIAMHLAYDEDATIAEGGCSAQEAGNFKITFLKDFIDEYDPGEGPQSVSAMVSDLLSQVELSSIAILDVEGESPCNEARGPSLYSSVSYSAGGKSVAYYSNKLPRIATEIANPAVVVHGNIYAPNAVSPSAEQIVQETGSVQVSGVRNTIYENIAKKLPEISLEPGTGGASKECTILGLQESQISLASGCDGRVYTVKKVEDQNVVYFSNVDVVMDFSRSAVADWTVVAIGGNIFVDGDIYSANNPKNLALITMAPFSAGCHNKGNVYIAPDVKNIQANIFADCSLFSYGGGGPDYGTGIGKIDNTVNGGGLYNWGGSSNMISTLNKQLVIQGSIASFNTVGGADSDEFGYLRNGFGKAFTLPATSAQRMEAQQYDLNYLRLFKLSLDVNEDGYPHDWSCDKYLSIEDILNIQLWNSTFGAEGEQVVGENGQECNGIDPLSSVAEGGDLVPPLGGNALAKELEEDDLDPVYIFFKPANSVLYTK